MREHRHACLGLHAAVNVHARYLLPVLAGSIVVGIVNIAWLVARYRARPASRESAKASGITAGSR